MPENAGSNPRRVISSGRSSERTADLDSADQGSSPCRTAAILTFPSARPFLGLAVEKNLRRERVPAGIFHPQAYFSAFRLKRCGGAPAAKDKNSILRPLKRPFGWNFLFWARSEMIRKSDPPVVFGRSRDQKGSPECRMQEKGSSPVQILLLRRRGSSLPHC